MIRHALPFALPLVLSLTLLCGCQESFDVQEASLRGTMGELEEFDRVPDTVAGWNTTAGSSIVRLHSSADDGSVVMTRLGVGGGLRAAAMNPEDVSLTLLGCSGPDGYYTFDRRASDVSIEIEPTSDPVFRRVHYRGEFEHDGRTQVVDGEFLYRIVGEDTSAAIAW